MDNTTDARTTHHNANIAREMEQDFPKSLAEADRAIVQYATEGDAYGVAETLCTRVLTLRHMADAAESDNLSHALLTYALHEAMAAVAIAEDANVSTAIPHLNLGKMYKIMGDLDAAIEHFQLAVEAQKSNPHETQNRPGVLANFEEILATAQLMNGDDSALERAESALERLEATDEEAYNKAVWLAHGHMRISAAIKDRMPDVAQKHYDIGEHMIRSNPDLVLSARKLEKELARQGK